jgi:Zn-dependent protease with chaperone function
MNVPVSEVWLMRMSVAQAFAIPGSRRLLFTERLLELLSDDEISAVCAHELAHLTEAWSDYYRRYVLWFAFLPWIFFKPTMHTFGVVGCLALMLISIVVARVYRTVSHKLELRADNIAHTHAPDAATYAWALARIYEDNLLPAGHSKEHNTHPHLYDRLVAAGMAPDYPRPLPAKSMALHGNVFCGALGLLITALIMRLAHVF